MTLHNLKYSLKTLFKNKMLIFWTYIFPIILGSLFYLAFHDIENKETFSAINIAVVSNNEFKNNNIWPEVISALSDEKSDNHLFNTKYLNETEAEEALDKNEIIGYLLYKENAPKVIIKKNGTEATIFKSVIEEVNSSSLMIENYIKEKISSEIRINPEINISEITNKYYNEAMNLLNIPLNIKDTTAASLSYTMIEYYTLIAMTCLYGGILGMVSINKNLANMSNHGKRVSVSPVPKKILVLSSATAAYIAQFIGVIILFMFTIFILKVDYGNNILLVLLTSLIGTFAGLMLGLFLACALKCSENTKLGIIISVTMLGSFLSGMMGITMKYIIDKNIPILNMINPANMITDAFYSLYYYDTHTRYFMNIISLVIFSCILLILSINSLRRQKYDSI